MNMIKKRNYSKSFYYLVRDIVNHSEKTVKPGFSGPITSEAILFSSNSSLAFPIRDVEDVKHNDPRKNHLPLIDMTVNFSGLTGCSSPLPEFYTENIIYSSEQYSPSGKLLDMFTHRLISFIYRNMELCRYLDTRQKNGNDQIGNNLFALFGMRNCDIRKYSEIKWIKLLPFTNQLRNRNASRQALEKLLSSYFNIKPIRIFEFIRQNTEIPLDARNILGQVNVKLGQDMSIGRTVVQYDSSIVIRLCSLSYRNYRHFFPNSKNIRILRKLISLVVKRPLTLNIQLDVKSHQIPNLVLVNTEVFQLGYNCWLGKPKQSTFRISL